MVNDSSNPSFEDGHTATEKAKPIRRLWLILLAAILSGFGVAYVSKDWCFTTVLGVLAAAVLTWLLDSILSGLGSVVKWRRSLQVVLVAIVVCTLGFLLRADPNAAFKRIIGIEPPPGVSELDVDSDVISPSGDRTTLVRFSATEEAIQAIAEARGLVYDEDTLDRWDAGEGNWLEFWKAAFSNFRQFGGEPWHEPPVMERPVLYKWRSPKNPTVSITLLWDETTGRAYVVCLSHGLSSGIVGS